MPSDDASAVLGSQQLAGVRVSRLGSSYRRAEYQTGLLGMLVVPLMQRVLQGRRPDGGQAQTPKFAVGLLAVTADALALVELKGAMLKSGTVIARVPLSDVATFDIGRGYVAPLTISFRNGDKWRLEVSPLFKKRARAVASIAIQPVTAERPRPTR